MDFGLSYWLRLVSLYRHYRRRNLEVPVPPVRLWIELSSRCDLRCVMCPNKDLPSSQKGDMPEEVFKKTVEDSVGKVFEVSLHHRGESLLHPQISQFVKTAVEGGMLTKLHTNGMRLDEAMAQSLVDAGLHRLSISFDGFDAVDYEKIRIGGDFERVVGNIRRLIAIRRESGARFPRVAVELIRLSPGQSEKKKMKEFLKRLGDFRPDQFVIKQPHNWAGYLASKRKKQRYTPCTFPWNALLILWNGDVSPCAQDFFSSYVLGNIMEQSLSEIWNGRRMKELRAGLAEGRYQAFKACIDCDRLWRETFLGIPREYLHRFLFKRMP